MGLFGTGGGMWDGSGDEPQFPKMRNILRDLEPGQKVRVTLPFSTDEGNIVTVVKFAGPVMLQIMGQRFLAKRSYQVFIDGYGDKDENTGEPIVYPPEFLEVVEPELQTLEKSTWIDFDALIGSNVASVIKNGVTK